MASIFDSIFGGTVDAMSGDLRRQGAVADRQAAAAANSSANRGGANPAAVASAASQAGAAQRAHNATAAAGALQQARLADRGQGMQILGGLLGTAGSVLGTVLPGAGVAGKVAGDVVSSAGQAGGGAPTPGAGGGGAAGPYSLGALVASRQRGGQGGTPPMNAVSDPSYRSPAQPYFAQAAAPAKPQMAPAPQGAFPGWQDMNPQPQQDYWQGPPQNWGPGDNTDMLRQLLMGGGGGWQ